MKHYDVYRAWHSTDVMACTGCRTPTRRRAIRDDVDVPFCDRCWDASEGTGR